MAALSFLRLVFFNPCIVGRGVPRVGVVTVSGNVSRTDHRIAELESDGYLNVEVNEPPAPARETDRIGEVLGDRCSCDGTARGPSGDILPARASGLVALGLLHGRSVDTIRLPPARRRRPGESVSGRNKTNLAGLRCNRPLSQRDEAGRDIRSLRWVDWIHRRREQFDRHGKSVCQLSIHRQFRPI